MNKSPTERPVIVFVGLGEPEVDRILDDVVELAQIGRCFVLGSNMSLLGAFETQWGSRVDLTLVYASAERAIVFDALALILERERVNLNNAIWVYEGPPEDVPHEVAIAIPAKSQGRTHLAKRIAQELSVKRM